MKLKRLLALSLAAMLAVTSANMTGYKAFAADSADFEEVVLEDELIEDVVEDEALKTEDTAEEDDFEEPADEIEEEAAEEIEEEFPEAVEDFTDATWNTEDEIAVYADEAEEAADEEVIEAELEEDSDTSEHTHTWRYSYCSWGVDYLTANIYLYCTQCGEESEAIPAEVKSVTKGKAVIYTATATYEGETYTASIVVIKKDDGEDITIDDETQADAVVEKGLYVENLYDRTYTGDAQTFSDLKAYWYTGSEKVLLVPGTDYTVKYANNKNAGDATVTLKGKGQYADKFAETYKFKISKRDVTGTSLSLNSSYQYVGGKTTIKLSINGKAVNKNQYTVTLQSKPEGAADIKFGQPYKAAGLYVWKVAATENSNLTGYGTIGITVVDKAQSITANKLKIKVLDKNSAITKDSEGNITYPTPAFTVTAGKETLKSTDEKFTSQFSVSYSNSNAGTGWIYVWAKSSESKIDGKTVIGTAYQKFTIKGEKLPDKFTALDGAVVPYTGYSWSFNEVLEELDIDREKFASPLVEDKDYYWYQTYRADVGTFTITFRGRGIYEGTITKTIKIVPFSDFGGFGYNALINDSWYDPEAKDDEIIEVPYTAGGAVVENFKLYRYYDLMLREGVDYTVSYSNNQKVGEIAKLTINGKGNYGKADVKFKVVTNTSKNVYTIPVEVKTADKVDKNKTPDVYDAITGQKLTAGKDYTASYASDAAVGSDGVMMVTIKNGSEKTYDFGEAGITLPAYNVAKTPISGKLVKIKGAKAYTGSAVKLTADDFTGLKLGEDFEIIGYKNNITAGSAKVIIRGIGKYGKTATLTFKITKFEKN